jgi:EF-P beta-lysylation protein EpmB
LAVRDPGELCRLLLLPPDVRTAAIRAAHEFPLCAPLEYVARMQPGNPYDPLLRQVLPIEQELVEVPGYRVDPVDDKPATVCPGLLKKYSGRALIVATTCCAVHCRYCFRRHLTRQCQPQSSAFGHSTLTALSGDPSVEEVLLSGGDPLTLPDEQLTELIGRLSRIPHLRRIRVHSRLPVVIPQRVTEQLPAILRSTRLTPILVVHSNHPNELDSGVARAAARLVDGGIPVLNQSVLLRGVNDCAETLIQLCQRLVDMRIMPYYLHQLDPVAGAAHFQVPIARGRRLIAQLRAALPGYAIPRYVQELPGHTGKKVLA